ncbi:MAG TPA: response regulator, partial [Gemmatimonadales bacterium]|nr:response regulator [Gemmatimonadales bacterium]
MNPLATVVPTSLSGALPQLPVASRVLIIDDDAHCTSALARLLRRAGLEKVQITSDPAHGVELFNQQEPDLVLLDLHMPRIDGFHLLTLLRSRNPGGPPVPIVMLTGDSEPQCRYRALAHGASDFLLKPLDPIEVLLRVRAQLETRELQCRLARHNQTLEAAVAARARELEAAQVEMLGRLAAAAELHDDDTGQHTQRVGELAGRLARELELPPAQVDLIARAAPLHDVGKIGIP